MAIRKEFAAVAAAFLVTSGVSWGSWRSDLGVMQQPRYRDGVDECLGGSSNGNNIELPKYNGNSLKQQGGAEKKPYETAEDGELSNVRQSCEEQPKKEPTLKEIAETMLKKLSAWREKERTDDGDNELAEFAQKLTKRIGQLNLNKVEEQTQDIFETLYNELSHLVAIEVGQGDFCGFDKTVKELNALRGTIYERFE